MGDHWSENHREYVARQAAQVIVEGVSVPSSTISSPAGTLSSSITMPGPEYSINAPLMDPMQSCLAEGGEPQGRMSAVRRFFCLLVTFDLLFTILVWLVCSLVGGQSLEKALFNQVVKYSIRTSLFDIVMTSAYRFVILILMFGLLRVMHWWPVAITTAGSSAFLIAKVFLCEWDKISNYTFSVILLLCSFILAWGETWFLDFRVLPQEQHARDLLDPERTHLLHNHRQQLPRYGDSVLGDNAPFYSPLESPAGSEDEETNSDLYPGRQRQLTQQEIS